MTALILAFALANPAPLDMPRADAYLVKDRGTYFLEDRYSTLDLWTADAVEGRWQDEDGRVFTRATLGWKLPASEEATATRVQYYRERSSVGEKNRAPATPPRAELAALAPVELAEEPRVPRLLPRGVKALSWWEGTNTTALVCTWLCPRDAAWSYASWELIPGDDPEVARTELTAWLEQGARSKEKGARSREQGAREDERALLRRDARHSVAAYPSWHATDGADFEVLDDLPTILHFEKALTNELVAARRDYARVMPCPVDGTNTLPVVRLYGSKEEYLANVGTDMGWTAAFWSPRRREVVGYLPEQGSEALLKTLRHEAFHQYLGYGAAMITTSPWINEGYAQYFEEPVTGRDVKEALEALGVGREEFSWAQAAQYLKGVFGMDYDAFYNPANAHLNYALAKSIAVFLELGAPEVRFQPFKDLKRDYLAALMKTQDRLRATAAAFGTEDRLKLFLEAWRKYYESM